VHLSHDLDGKSMARGTAMNETIDSAIRMALAQERERIAKMIDDLCSDECQIAQMIHFHNAHERAARIARGLVE